MPYDLIEMMYSETTETSYWDLIYNGWVKVLYPCDNNA